MLQTAIAIMTYDGRERDTAYSDATLRVGTLLQSMYWAGDTLPKVYVCHDGPIPEKSGLVNLKGVSLAWTDKWGGVSANYNHAMRVTAPCEYVILMQDDQVVLRDWLHPMLHFIERNEDLPIDAWSFHGVYVPEQARSEFYKTPIEKWYERSKRLLEMSFGDLLQSPRWWHRHPDVVGNPWGSAMVVRRSVWEAMGGFWEDVFQPDEQYGVHVYRNTKNVCVWVPTGLCINMSNGSTWPLPEPDCYTQSRWNWEKHIGVPFDERGQWWLQRAGELQDVRTRLANSNYVIPRGWE